MNKKRIETEEQLLYALEDFFCNSDDDKSIDIIENELRNLGYDPIRLEQLGRRISAQYLASKDWRNTAKDEIKVARERLDETRFQTSQKMDRASLLSEIQKILFSFGNQDSKFIPAHFRNFETATESDLLSILNQLQYLKSNKSSKGEE